MLKSGDIILDRYKIVEILGQGGQVQVYLSEDQKQDNLLIVLKELVFKGFTEKDKKIELTLFEREAKILQKVSHHNLPKVFDLFTFEDSHFIAEEYIKGIPLNKLLKQTNGKIPEKRALNFALQMTELLLHLHHHKPPIIIRDIKPSNIIIKDDDSLYFIDFTIARYLKKNREDTIRMGSPGYAPPEQYSGHCTAQSDIYSLGVTLHQCLTGYDPIKSPFNIPNPSKLNANLNEKWDGIISKACHLSVEARYSCTKELEEDLLTLKSDLSKNDRTCVLPQPLANLKSFIIKKRKSLILTGAIISVILIFFASMLYFLQYKRSEYIKSSVCFENLNYICEAVAIYESENSSFPDNLNKLLPKYIHMLPECPKAGKMSYSIEKIKEAIYKINEKEYLFTTYKVFCNGAYHKNIPEVYGNPFKTMIHKKLIDEKPGKK